MTITRNFKVFGILVLVIIATGTMYLSQLDKAEAQQIKKYDAYAGEYVQAVSYWGYTKSDEFTTLRLQSSSNQADPLVYVTFKDSELPVTTRLDGRIFEISYYDNEKISVKETLAS